MTGRLVRRLRAVGVEVTDHAQCWLRCLMCAAVWSPNMRPGGRLGRGYYHCPDGCNQDRRIR